GGPDNVRLPERGTTEHVGKEHAPGISGPRAQRSRIGNIDGGEALVRDRILRTGAVVENASHAVGLRTAELAVQIAELDADDDVVPLTVVTKEAAVSVAVDRYLTEFRPLSDAARVSDRRIGEEARGQLLRRIGEVHI